MAEGMPPRDPPPGAVAGLIRFCLEQKLVVALLAAGVLLWGLMVSPLEHDLDLPRDRVAVDAIPDLGENQQIVFVEWPGRSPQDVDDQVTYPLTVSLLGLPGVKDVRSTSMFGFSMVAVIFEENIDFYWSRARILEKLNALPPGTLPDGVSPALGPDATGLGQVFWYTLEGRDERGEPTGGWDLDELRSIQDFIVQDRLAAVPGVSEVASIGGYVREYQIDVDPAALRAADISLEQVIGAVRQSNVDVGARTIEINKAEYLVRGLGTLGRSLDPEQTIRELEQVVVAKREQAPVLLRDLADVGIGPALRRGALTRSGSEAVGGVVVARFGENPLAVIERVKDEIERIEPGLPRKTLEDGTVSRLAIVPFYDRSGLIHETLGTLEDAIAQQVLVTILVVVLMVMHLRSSLLISAMLPLAVLMTFIGMKLFGVDANVVALSGIAIAVGSIVDMGIVLMDSILRRLEEAPEEEPRLEVIWRASAEVGSAVMTAVMTTIVGFLPVFTMVAAEGKLFRPLAYTKTFALVASILIALTVLPPVAHVLLGWRIRRPLKALLAAGVVAAGVAMSFLVEPAWAGVLVALFGAWWLAQPWLPRRVTEPARWAANVVAVAVVLGVLAREWEPLGPERTLLANGAFIAVLVFGLLGLFWLVRVAYPALLGWALRHKVIALLPAAGAMVLGATIWLGFDRLWGWLPEGLRKREAMVELAHAFPGLGREFMPALDEGAFLYMPTTGTHASIGEATDILKALDLAIESVPEVEEAIGKIGRVESALDPAPVSMVETIVRYRTEYASDERGRRLTFAIDPGTGDFRRDEAGGLIEDPHGRPYRQWREHVRSPQDIWDEIAAAAEIPGVTGAPKLQPIETRLVMLQTGIRSPFAVKIFGPDLAAIDAFAREVEDMLREIPSVAPASVNADRLVGKPYLEIDIDREEIARYGLRVADVQEVIEVAIGGRPLTTTIEGRERYPVRVRYPRERRDEPETLGQVLVPIAEGEHVPLEQLAHVRYRGGPQMIKSEDAYLVGYVLFDRVAGRAELEVVADVERMLRERVGSGELRVPAGVSWRLTGMFENQVRAARRLAIVLPLSLAIIFVILYLQFRSVATTLIVFSGVFVAWGGGFVMLWLYGQPWFLDVSLLGQNLRELLGVRPFNLSVAVWVGFLALFGIATDDGVVIATRLRQSEAERPTETIEGLRVATVEGAKLRVRATLMTSATTILALLPVLTSTGRGSDIMIPMAIPVFGGMTVALLTLFATPVLWCWVQEWRLRAKIAPAGPTPRAAP